MDFIVHPKMEGRSTSPIQLFDIRVRGQKAIVYKLTTLWRNGPVI